MVIEMSKCDNDPVVDPKGPRNNITCLSCRHFRVPDWIPEGMIETRPREVAFYATCERWRETQDPTLVLVMGEALERAVMVRCADARSIPEMCGPTGRSWEAKT